MPQPPTGYSSTPLYGLERFRGFVPNFNAPTYLIDPPVIFEPTPTLLAGNPNEVWIGVSPPASATNWGGCQIWISTDGSSYAQIGRASGRSTIGFTVGDLPSGTAVDTVHTLSVDLRESLGQLNSVSSADAAAMVATLCWLSDAGGPDLGEFMSFQTATLTGPNQYDLITLYRAGFASPNEDHPDASMFVLIDTTITKIPYDPSLVGQTIFFKFPSINHTGGAVQSLDQVPVYGYTLTGGVRVAYPVSIEWYFGSSTPTASESPNEFVAPFPVAFAPDFGSVAGGAAFARNGVAATSSANFDVQKALLATPHVWTSIGTVNFAGGAAMGTFATNSHAAQSLAAGDSIRIVAPGSPDATLAGVSVTLVGSR